jgi:ribosome-binding factor A
MIATKKRINESTYNVTMSRRPAMLASVIRTMIAPVLTTCPPECGVVSITEIEVSGDCSIATVYISALQEAKKALQYLEGKRAELERSFGQLQRYRIPRLRFRIDPRTERGGRMDELLKDA